MVFLFTGRKRTALEAGVLVTGESPDEGVTIQITTGNTANGIECDVMIETFNQMDRKELKFSDESRICWSS